MLNGRRAGSSAMIRPGAQHQRQTAEQVLAGSDPCDRFDMNCVKGEPKGCPEGEPAASQITNEEVGCNHDRGVEEDIYEVPISRLKVKQVVLYRISQQL